MTRFDATGRRPVDKWTAAPRLTTSPQGQQPQQKRSIDLVHKPVNSECSRHSWSIHTSDSVIWPISGAVREPGEIFFTFFSGDL